MSDNFNRKSLEERREAAVAAREETEIKIRKALELVLNSEEGLVVLRYLFHLSGGGENLMKTQPEITMAMVARHDLYNEMRKHISSANLSKIERHFWE